MNQMKEVAKLLGVELNEEFYIEGYICLYKVGNEGLMYLSNKEWHIVRDSTLMLLLLGRLEIEKPILDKKEKEYLSAVIKPFRNKADVIIKYQLSANYSQIVIGVNSDNGYEIINLPMFKTKTMYKGMELKKQYSLEELGL